MRGQRLLDESPHRGTVEHRRRRKYDVADLAAGPTKQTVRVKELSSAREEEADPTRVDGDREDQVGRSLRRAKGEGSVM
jgi:hypothetical protein